MVPTYTVDTCYHFPPGRRTEGGTFVVTYVLSVRCVVYVKGLGEAYMALDSRSLLLLRLIKPKTGQAGNSKIVYIFNAEKTWRIKVFVVESALRVIQAF